MCAEDSVSNEILAERIQAGNDIKENMLQLWRQNEKFLYTLVRQYRGYGELDDLMQESYFGLYKAAMHYNPEKNSTFLTYAKCWVLQIVRRYLENCGTVVRVPVYTRRVFWKYKRIQEQYVKEFGREMPDPYAQEKLGISDELMECVHSAMNVEQCRSLNEYISEDGETTLGDMLPGPATDINRELDQGILYTRLWKIIDSMGQKEAAVIREVYEKGGTLVTAGEKIGVTRERARQIKEKVFDNLRKDSESIRFMRSYYDVYLKDSCIYPHVSLSEYKCTWTSQPEKELIKKLSDESLY